MAERDGSSTRFVGRLEALRGIASLWVAVEHSLIWLAIGSETEIGGKTVWQLHGTQATIARMIISAFSGFSAVDIFFVLSGFVLARSLRDAPLSPIGWGAYAVRRIMRIVPAYWFSLAVIALYLLVVYPGHIEFSNGSKWMNQWYTDPLGSALFFRNAVFLDYSINPNSWTLKVEVINSLLMPIISLALLPRSRKWAAIVLALSVSVGFLFRHDPLSWGYYSWMFVVGAVLEKVSAGENKPSEWGDLACVVIAAACSLAASACFTFGHAWPADPIVVAGAALFIYVAAKQNKANFLNWLDRDWCRFLGRVSYSFYLLHFIVLYSVGNMLLRVLPEHVVARFPVPIMIATAIVTVAATLLLAAISHRYVEVPFTRLGRILAGYISGTRSGRDSKPGPKMVA